VKILSLPAHGTLTLASTAVTIGQEIPLGSLNQLLFTPDKDWYGNTSFLWNGEDSLAYAASGVNASISVLGLDVFLPFILH